MRIIKIVIICLVLAMAILVGTASSTPGEVIGKYWKCDPPEMHYYVQLRKGFIKETVEVNHDLYDRLTIGGEYTE